MMRRFFSLLFIIVILLSTTSTHAALYATWDVLELDACASAWLFKRFVDKKGTFKFFPKGEFIEEGIPFDTPDAEFRRRHGVSTFGSIVAKYKIKEPKVKKIEKLIHQIEINYWKGDASSDAEQLNTKIKEIIDTTKNPHEILEKAFAVLDDLYERS